MSKVTVTDGSASTVVVESADGPQGVQGPPGQTGPKGDTGPPGASGPAAHYTHVQNTPAAVWTVAHGLGFNAAVTVVDSGGTVVEGDIAYPDLNTVVLTFSAGFSGFAYLS